MGEIDSAADIHLKFTPIGYIRDPGTQLYREKLTTLGRGWLGIYMAGLGSTLLADRVLTNLHMGSNV